MYYAKITTNDIWNLTEGKRYGMQSMGGQLVILDDDKVVFPVRFIGLDNFEIMEDRK